MCNQSISPPSRRESLTARGYILQERGIVRSRTTRHAKWCVAPLQLSLDPFQEVRSPYWCRWTQPVSANVSHVLASQRSPSLGPSSFSSSSSSCRCSSASSFVDSSSSLLFPLSLPPSFLTRALFLLHVVVRLFVLSRSLARPPRQRRPEGGLFLSSRLTFGASVAPTRRLA